MAQCIHCGAENAQLPFRVLEVQTLHIRDMNGERRVQALGLFQNWAVCANCAEKRLVQAAAPGYLVLKKALPFAAVLLIGILLTVLLPGQELAMRLPGPAAIFCGLAGIISSTRRELTQARALTRLPHEEALHRAAWELLLASAPKKDGDNDLTYIPDEPRIRSMSAQELSQELDLLPAIAEKALRMLQGKDA